MIQTNTVMVGVTSEIGFAVAEKLLAQDHHLVILERNPEEFMDCIAPVLQDRVTGLELDLAHTGSVADAGTYLQSINTSALIYCAGISAPGAAEDCYAEDFHRVMQVNFFSALQLTRAVLPAMRRARNGRVVLMSSLSGLFGLPGEAAYCSSKFALEGLAESIRYEISHYGINVSVVNPAYTGAELATKLQFLRSVPEASPYYAHLGGLLDTQQVGEGESVSIAADAVLDAVLSETPADRYLPGSAAKTYELWKAASDVSFSAVVADHWN